MHASMVGCMVQLHSQPVGGVYPGGVYPIYSYYSEV